MSESTRRDGSVDGTRRDAQAPEGKTRLDLPQGANAPSGYSAIPAELAAQYQIVSALPAQGAEADLFLVQKSGTEQKFVLKLYRRGLKPKAEVVDKLRSCSREHVVEIVACGESDGQWYEALEYGAYGTLRDLLREGPIKETQMLDVVRELHAAIEHIHAQGIIHRDLKPENILIRTLQPLDLMLADFGIASLSEATQHFTTKSRTIKYGAPETAAGAVGNASDYWSLGLVILEGLTGNHPFDGISDMAIALQLATRRSIDVPVTDTRWQRLCKGLLTWDPKKRWSATLVGEWLAGGLPDVAADAPERPSMKPYKIVKQECWTATELALTLGRNWSAGLRHVARNLILPWLRDEWRDQDAANLIIDLAEDRSLSNEARLVRLIAGLGRGLPPVWRKMSLDQESLVAQCQQALLERDAAKEVEALFDTKVLEVWGEAGNEDCSQWNRLWTNAAREFVSSFEAMAKPPGVPKPVPDRRAYLPALLQMILSPQYLKQMQDEFSKISSQADRCEFISPDLDRGSIGTLAALLAFQEDIVDRGNREIDAAIELTSAIRQLRRDYSELLAVQPGFRQDLNRLEKAIRENHAYIEVAETLPDLQRRMFAAARPVTTRFFNTLRRQQWFKIAMDRVCTGWELIGSVQRKKERQRRGFTDMHDRYLRDARALIAERRPSRELIRWEGEAVTRDLLKIADELGIY